MSRLCQYTIFEIKKLLYCFVDFSYSLDRGNYDEDNLEKTRKIGSGKKFDFSKSKLVVCSVHLLNNICKVVFKFCILIHISLDVKN